MASDAQPYHSSLLNGDGDLGTLGLESRSPSSASFGITQPSSSTPTSQSTDSLYPPAAIVQADLPESQSPSSLSSAYLSAEEVSSTKSIEVVPKPLPKDRGTASMSHHNSIASISTITPSPFVAAGSHQHESTSVDPELENDISSARDDDMDPATATIRTKGHKSSQSKRRSCLPPLQNRLPVGEGGPRAPPRNASVREPTSRYSGSAAGHGDLGAATMPSSFSSTDASGGGGPPASSLSSFLDLDSPRTSESSSQPRTVPGRRTSLHLTPSQLKSSSSGPSSSTSSSPRTSRLHPTSPLDGSSATTPSSTAAFDREAMQRWVLSVGCVNFDLELGPDLQFLYPPLGISREERDNIAFSSFPDTSIFDDGSSVFSWRVREVPLDSSGSEPPTIRSIQESLQQTALDDETPRPSLNNTAHQQSKRSSTTQPLAPTSPSRSGVRDSLNPSSSQASSASRQQSNVNTSPAHAHSSFHERLQQKFFPSSSTAMGRQISHDRHSSTTSTSSAASFDEETETASPLASSANATTSATASTAPRSTDLLAPRRAGNSTSSSYIYGYVFFRQKPDSTNKRGYFQKSVVILSHLPYVGLFGEVVSRLGPLFFEHGLSMFEAFANDVMSWPAPQPGTVLTLPLLGSLITAAIPFGQQPQNSPNNENLTAFSNPSVGTSSLRASASMNLRARVKAPLPSKKELPNLPVDAEGPLLASIPSTSLFDTFREALSDLWLLWECVLLAEPILVIAPDPKAASEAVWHMLDLVRPIPYAGDFRPYFHIHDYDFKTLVTKNKPQAGTLIAATNPFFATTCGHWPNMLRVGKPAVKLITIKPGTGSSAGGKKSASGPISGGIGGGHGAGGGGPDHNPGFTSKRKRRISKDRQLLKKLQDLASSCAKNEKEGLGSEAAARAAANTTMRRYFADLTERFLAPLNRYVASLVPATFDLASPSEVPKIRPFNTLDFLASLKAHGTPLAIRSRSLPTGATVRQNLYLDFLKCPNFSLWLHSRVAAAEEEQRRRYIATLLQGDVTTFGHTRGEIETIDLYSRLVEEIRLVDVQLTSPTEPGPGSRWRTDKVISSTNAATTNLRSKSLPRKGVDQADGPSGSGRNTPTSVLQPTTEKRLLDQKTRLMMQLEKLCQTLPDDLQGSLRRSA